MVEDDDRKVTMIALALIGWLNWKSRLGLSAVVSVMGKSVRLTYPVSWSSNIGPLAWISDTSPDSLSMGSRQYPIVRKEG